MRINYPNQDEYGNQEVEDSTELMFRFIFLKFIGYLNTFIFLIFISIYDQNLIIVPFPSITCEILIFVILVYNQFKNTKYLLTFALLELFFDIFFKVFFLITIKNNYSKIYSLSIGIIHLVLNFMSFNDQSRVVFLPILLYTNSIYYATSMLIFLRLDNIISWRIYICICPVYLFLFIIFIFGLLRIKIFYNMTKKLSLNSLNKDLRKNFEFFTSIIYLSSHITAIYLIYPYDDPQINLNLTISLQTNPIITKASIPMLIFSFIEVIYILSSKKKIKKYLKNMLFLRNLNIVNDENIIVVNTEINQILSNEEYNNYIHDFQNNEQYEMKNIVLKYADHLIPKQLIRKSSCYYIPFKAIRKSRSIIKPIEIKRRSNSQSDLSYTCKIVDKKLVVLKKVHREFSLDISENEIEDTKKTVCLFCCDKFNNGVFMKCGHGGICYTCSKKMWKNGVDCHICRKKIDQVLEISLDIASKKRYNIVSATFVYDNQIMKKFKKELKNNFYTNYENNEKRLDNLTLLNF